MASGSRNSSMSGLTVGGKYRLVRQIGCHVHLAVTAGNAEQVAVKLESTTKASNSRSSKQKNRNKFQNKSQDNYEAKVYRILQGGEGVPSVRWSGQEKGYSVFVMDLLGSSLEDLFKSRSPRRFTLKTVLMIADQMISRVEYVHSKYYIHRDIRPENFLMGLGKNCNTIYLIDFSLAKKYCDPRSKKHMPYHEDKIMQSAALFASISAHRGIEQSRRDDMESLGYVLVYFLKGHLPWEGIKAETQRKLCEKIGEKKMSTPVEVLCKDFPGEFATYLNYCRGLEFDEDPDYAYLRQLFRTLYSSLNYQDDDIFNWTAEATATTTAYPAGDSSTPGQKRDAEGDQEESSKRKKVE